MAEYLIQDTTLDAIADAINAKTGGSSAMTPAQMVTAIENIPSSGGGMSWELIADYTSDADASAVEVTIPSEKQDSNIYRVHYQHNTVIWYGRCGFNSVYSGYSGQTTWDCNAYIVKTPVGNSNINGTNPASYYTMNPPMSTVRNAEVNISDAPLQSVGMARYDANHTIPAGLNIKVWRLIES